MNNQQYIVISLGGSLIVPDGVDVPFVKEFRDLILGYVNKGFKFLIITGGGRIARQYTLTAKEIGNTSNTDLDLIGIATTRLNAELIRVSFGASAHQEIIFNPEIIPEIKEPIVIGGGWKPGNSSDLAAVVSAKTIGAHKVINLSNIDYVYDKDPRYDINAKKIENISWDAFIALLPKDWDPGLNSPFDPIAAREAQTLGLEVAILNGRNMGNLKKYLDGEAFIGSVIK
jgi:uridylate kinase